MVRGIQFAARGCEPFTVNREPDTLQGELPDTRWRSVAHGPRIEAHRGPIEGP